MFGRMVGLATATLLLVAAPITNAAGQESEIERCRAVADSLERLTCYDSIPAEGSTQVASGAFRKVALDEFKVDQDAMIGQKVELAGNLTIFGDWVMLQDGQMDMSPIVVEFANIPRDQRLRIIQRCNMGCRAVVQGEVGSVFFQTGVIAESISVR